MLSCHSGVEIEVSPYTGGIKDRKVMAVIAAW